jgi:CBS domain-containing protein
MADVIRDVMTPDPVVLSSSTTLHEAARAMKEHHIGDVLVRDDDRVCGIVTDRDIVVRAIAEGREPDRTTLEEVCTHELVTLSPDDAVADAVRTLREHAVRRLPVLDGDRPVGMVSLGDLAIERDAESVLADISSAPPNDT